MTTDTGEDLFTVRHEEWKQAEARADALARQIADELLAPRAWRRPSSIVRVKELLAKYDTAAQQERATFAEFQAHVNIGTPL